MPSLRRQRRLMEMRYVYEMKIPWECPRCGRINSPWNPACFCKKDEGMEKLLNWKCCVCDGPHPDKSCYFTP